MKFLIFLIFVIVLFNPLYSQDNDIYGHSRRFPEDSGNDSKVINNFTFDFSLILSKAQKEFGRNVKNLGYGINVIAGYNFASLPFITGISFDALTYGSDTRIIPFSYYSDLVTLEQETSNNIIMLHLLLRLQPVRGKIRPYVDFLYGFKYLYTETSIRDEDEYDDEDNEIASSINIEDTALSKGAGGGVAIRIYSWSKDPQNPQNGSLFINIGSRYLWGSNAEYLNVNKEGWIEISDPEDGPVTTTLYPDNSRTNLLTYQVGISVIF